jgi:2-oxoglutarate ferredoxin oxidoreductase subunit beta
VNREAEGVTKELVAGTPALFVSEWWTQFLWDMYCPGCQTPIVGRIIAEAIEELGVGDRGIMVMGNGCHAYLAGGLDFDVTSGGHGRAPDIATAMKRVWPEAIVFTVQGDGDCIAIGADALIGALGRGEMLTIIMVNNTNYGTTGGQMAPTTVVGQVTTTSPRGRNPAAEGFPTHAAELVATFKGVAFSARGSLHTAANYQRTKKYVTSAFQKQIGGIGLGFVEVITACPPNWHLTPGESLEWIEHSVIAEFPLGEFKNVTQIE